MEYCLKLSFSTYHHQIIKVVVFKILSYFILLLYPSMPCLCFLVDWNGWCIWCWLATNLFVSCMVVADVTGFFGNQAQAGGLGCCVPYFLLF